MAYALKHSHQIMIEHVEECLTHYATVNFFWLHYLSPYIFFETTGWQCGTMIVNGKAPPRCISWTSIILTK